MLPQNKNKNAEKVQSYIKEEKVPLGTNEANEAKFRPTHIELPSPEAR